MKFEEVNFDEVLPDNSIRYRLLESGAVMDRTTGKIVARKTDSAYARSMTNKRWEEWRKNAGSAILKEVQAIDPTIQTEQEAWGYLVAKQFITFLDAEKPRGDDLVKFGQVLGAMPTIADVKQEAQQAGDEAVTFTEKGLKMLLAMLTEKPEVIEGEAT